MEIGRGLVITGVGVGVVYLALTAMWLAMAVLGRLPSGPPGGETSAQPPREESPSAQPQEEEVAAMAAALLQAQQGGAARRPLGPWRAVARMAGITFRDRGN